MSPVAQEGGHGWVVLASGAALYLLNGIIFFLQGMVYGGYWDTQQHTTIAELPNCIALPFDKPW